MAVDSKNNFGATAAAKAKRFVGTPSSARQTSTSSSGEIARVSSASSKRCLRDASLSDERLELLATFDFKPLSSAQNRTLAGEMFDLRITERAADLESVMVTLTNLAETNPGGYATAVNTYNSALVGSEADVALLKILLLLEKYATHTSRFEPFISEYEIPEAIDVSFLGETTFDILREISAVDLTKMSGKATQLLLQVCAALNCSTYGITPRILTNTERSEQSTRVITKFDASESNFSELMYNIAFISRDLTFSREMTRIRDDMEPDPEFKELFEAAYGTNFATSARNVNDVIMPAITGFNGFSSLRRGGLKSQSYVTGMSVDSLLSSKAGIASKLRHKQNVLLPETNAVSYSRQYDNIEDIVNEAFFGAKPLDFTEFSSAIDNMTKQITDSVMIGKNSFRMLDASAGSDGTAVSPPIASEEQPLSMASVAAVSLDTLTRRFSSTVLNSLQTPFYDWMTPEHVNYTKVLAWLLIKDKPDIAKKLVRAVFEDYDAGHLTALGVPGPIEGTAEVDDEGNEIEGTEEISPVINVKPGTDSRVSLSGVRTRLISRIYLINQYYQEEVHQVNPSAILSGYRNEDINFPQIRTNYSLLPKEVVYLFGDSNYSRNDPDLRLINAIFCLKERENSADSSKNFSTNIYLSSKIIAAEIIDSVLEVLRELTAAFVEVPAAEDGDPVFPFIDQFAGPYGVDNSTWGYSGPGYESFSFSQWVSTISEARNLFTRSTDKVTYFRATSIESICEKIVEIFSSLMSKYYFLKPMKETITSTRIISRQSGHQTDYITPTCAMVKYTPVAGITLPQVGGFSIDNSVELTDFFEAMDDINTGLLNSTFATLDSDADSISASLPNIQTNNDFMTPISVLRGNLQARKHFLQTAKREDDSVSFLYDFLQKYADRVNAYKTATLDLVEGEGAPLGELIASLREAGPAGEDVLQNMSVNQMALKQIAIKEECGDEDNGYLPKLSILNDSELNAIHVLCEEPILTSPEGDTTKAIMVGVPTGVFDKNQVDSEFCLKISYTDIEYPQLVFRSKSYKFDKDLYILPEDMQAANIRKTNSFSDVVDKIKFSKLRVEVIESEDATASIRLEDDVQTLRVDDDDREIYTNLAVSETLKMYYRVMLGVNFSEIAFPSTPEGVNIPVSDSTAQLAQSMADQISAVSNYSGELADNLRNLVSDITTFENIDDFVDGELQPVDAALLGDLRNAYQSRVFSPDLLRSRIVSAKMFDRVFAVPVDPDEFYIVPPGEPQIGDVSTSQEVFDFYLNGGIIEETGLAAPFAYKLAPRRNAEGSMALGSVSITLASVDNDSDTEEMLEV